MKPVDTITTLIAVVSLLTFMVTTLTCHNFARRTEIGIGCILALLAAILMKM